jgi:NAD-dependent dihydropyrimidine dehydrogenase PreA subunit
VTRTVDSGQLSYRQVTVGRFPTGMRGLEEIFAALCEQHTAPAAELGPELVALAKRHNYIPSSAKEEFAVALLREYRRYFDLKRSGQVLLEQETWRGVPRHQIPWFPMLDKTLCDGCDKCLQFCSHGVYAKQDDDAVSVAEPLNCVVGCDACARLCRHGAITFPRRSVLRTLIR